MPTFLFRSKTQENIQTVEARLDTARADLAVAEDRLSAASLDIALSDDPTVAAEPYQAALDRAAKHVLLMEAALAEAERLERERLVKIQSEEVRARNRAIRAQIGLMERAARRYAIAVENSFGEFRELLAASGKIEKLLPPGADSFRLTVSYRRLRDLAEREMNRQGLPHPLATEPAMPGTKHGAIYEQPGTVTPICDDLKTKLGDLYRQLTGEPVTAPEPVTEPEADPPVAEQPEPEAA